MNPLSPLPKPLPHAQFYILLALTSGEHHRYDLGAIAQNASLGSVKFPDGKLYPLVDKMCDEGLIDLVSVSPAGPSGQPRKHYAIGKYGTIRLQEEIQRMSHAVDVAAHAGITNRPDVSTEVQRLLLGL